MTDSLDEAEAVGLSRVLAALVARTNEREALGEIIWTASRADESTISATGANIVADAILAAGYRKTEVAR